MTEKRVGKDEFKSAGVVTILIGYLVNSDVLGFMLHSYDGPYLLELQSAWLAALPN